MTWQLFSPDLPFLNQITVSQHLSSFWDNPLPYVPAIGAVISALGIVVTAWLAQLARGVAKEQKKIAKDKLDIDLFNKRIEVYQSFMKMYNFLASRNFTENSEIEKEKIDLLSSLSFARFIYSSADIDRFEVLRMKIEKSYQIRKKEKNIDSLKSDLKKRNIYTDLSKNLHDFKDIYAPELRSIIKKYLPDVLDEQFKRLDNSTTSPASHPELPPTASKQAQ